LSSFIHGIDNPNERQNTGLSRIVNGMDAVVEPAERYSRRIRDGSVFWLMNSLLTGY
jgi:hypothetical protein